MYEGMLRTPAEYSPRYVNTQDCSARIKGGIPESEILRRLEETDISGQGFKDYDSFLNLED